MSPKDARIAVLEDALAQAYWTVEFLHDCLVHPTATHNHPACSYEYPEQTINSLKEWAKLVKIPKLCHHSYFASSCDACQERANTIRRLAEARKLLLSE